MQGCKFSKDLLVFKIYSKNKIPHCRGIYKQMKTKFIVLSQLITGIPGSSIYSGYLHRQYHLIQ